MRTAVALGSAAAATLVYALLRRPQRSSPQRLVLTLCGFGAVNKALARLIHLEAETLRTQHGLVVVYHAIIARHGAWEAQPGHELDTATVAALADAGTRLDGREPPPMAVRASATPSVADIRAMIARASAPARGDLRCVAEAIDVSYDDGEPAATYLADALARGSHAVSANKGPVVHKRAALLALAARHGVRFLHESAVMDGVPLFSLWRGGFVPGGARLTRFRGVLNATTGVVLSGMEAGQPMEVALRTAQEAGIAEADPSGDLSGYDAAVKLVAIAIACGLAPALTLRDVDISGIEHVTPQAAAAAVARGHRLRLVAFVEAASVAGGVRAYVRTEELQPSDPLFALQGADSAVTLETDRLAPVTVLQKGSEVTDTAFGQYADILRAVRPEPV